MNKRLLLIPLAAAVAAGIAFTASTTTGANFSDTKTGAIDGTVGQVRVTGSGGDGTNNMDLHFNGLLPGVPQAVTSYYTNTGSGPEDIYVVFNNATALSALNDLGTYGEVHIDINGTEMFASKNLNDNYPCGTPSLDPATIPPLCPVPQVIKVASNLAPNAYGSWTFQFNYGTKLSQQPGVGTTVNWNTFPAADGQKTVNASDGTGNGLPYEFVAEQPGVVPAV